MGDIWRATKGKQKVRVQEQKGSARTRGGHVPVTYTSVQHSIQKAKRRAKIPSNATHVTGSDRTTMGEKVNVMEKKKQPRQPSHLMHQAMRSLDKAGYESEKGQRHALGMSGKEVHRVKKHVKHKLLGFDSNKGFIAGEMQRKSYKAAHKRADKARRKAVF